MKWFFILLMPFAILGAYFFYTHNMFAAMPPIPSTSTAQSVGTPVNDIARIGSGIRGIAYVECGQVVCTDEHISVSITHSSSTVATFDVVSGQQFEQSLPTGEYDIVGVAASTTCASLHVAITANSFMTVNLRCL